MRVKRMALKSGFFCDSGQAGQLPRLPPVTALATFKFHSVSSFFALEGSRPMNDQQLLNTVQKPGRRRLRLAGTAVVLGLLSFVVGLRLFTSPKPGASADGSRPLASSTTDEPAAGLGPL